MEFTKERLEKIVNNLCAWAAEHDNEFINAFLDAGDFTLEEAKHFELNEEKK